MRTIFLLILAISNICFGQKAVSFYSTTNPKFVAAIADSSSEDEPEIDHFEHLCPGYGGFELLHRSGDSRSWLDIRFNGKTSELYSETMRAGRGGFVAKQNDTVEWRGILEDDIFTPYAIIYRVIAQDPEDETKSLSTLVVIALNRGDAKILGVRFGKDEDAEAKKLADTTAP
ncbi:hypothetical protein ACFSSA_15275 [Luteolibacter algae]|uniref:Uncharacterized protein n=1 Tax=Luteolibacter algae TaxID=454151 RepID=A0ABW5DBD3_9BACT